MYEICSRHDYSRNKVRTWSYKDWHVSTIHSCTKPGTQEMWQRQILYMWHFDFPLWLWPSSQVNEIYPLLMNPQRLTCVDNTSLNNTFSIRPGVQEIWRRQILYMWHWTSYYDLDLQAKWLKPSLCSWSHNDWYVPCRVAVVWPLQHEYQKQLQHHQSVTQHWLSALLILPHLFHFCDLHMAGYYSEWSSFCILACLASPESPMS